jgi:hypothetical protein
MAAAAPRLFLESVPRRVMFALELTDPVTGLRVTEGLRPRVDGLAPPLLNASGRFVWRLDDAPAARPVTVALAIDNPMYGPPAAPLQFTVAANDGTAAPADLIQSFALTTTSLYLPPAGWMAAVGKVVKGGGSSEPIAGVAVVVELSHDEGAGIFASSHQAVTDAAGTFAAVLKGLTDEKPDREPTDPGGLKAWLRLDDGTSSIVRPIVPALRPGRVTYLSRHVKWTPDPP